MYPETGEYFFYGWWCIRCWLWRLSLTERFKHEEATCPPRDNHKRRLPKPFSHIHNWVGFHPWCFQKNGIKNNQWKRCYYPGHGIASFSCLRYYPRAMVKFTKKLWPLAGRAWIKGMANGKANIFAIAAFSWIKRTANQALHMTGASAGLWAWSLAPQKNWQSTQYVYTINIQNLREGLAWYDNLGWREKSKTSSWEEHFLWPDCRNYLGVDLLGTT